jgi:dUTP pyrophosphatase
MILKVYRLNKQNPLPDYMSHQASGIDLFASVDHDVSIDPGEYKVIPTGIRVSLPRGYEAQLRPRSGLALKYGVTVLNSPGTIDADYRGEVKVILINHGKKPFIIRNMMRVG